MVRTENISAKLSFLRATLKRIERFKGYSREDLFSDPDRTAALERYLFLATQAAIDSIEMYCKLNKLGRPQSMQEAVRILLNSGKIPQSLAEKLSQMIGFRNYLSHGYEYIDQQIIVDVLQHRLVDLEELARVLEATKISF